MAKCFLCGKSGLFFHVNTSGICKDCANKEQIYGLTFSKDEQSYIDNKTGGLWIGNKPERKGIYDMTFNGLVGAVSYAITAKKYELAKKLLLLAEQKADGVVVLHFCYNSWIELLYKQREDPECLKECIEYCKKDIDMFPEFSKEYIKEYPQTNNDWGLDIRLPSFERLAIIYEKQGLFEEAIKICELSILYNLRSSTKSGFNGRLERLEAKLHKNLKSIKIHKSTNAEEKRKHSSHERYKLEHEQSLKALNSIFKEDAGLAADNNYGLSNSEINVEYGQLLKRNKNFKRNDAIWGLLNDKQLRFALDGSWGKYSMCQLKMVHFLMNEGRHKDALTHMCAVLFVDLSGSCDTDIDNINNKILFLGKILIYCNMSNEEFYKFYVNEAVRYFPSLPYDLYPVESKRWIICEVLEGGNIYTALKRYPLKGGR